MKEDRLSGLALMHIHKQMSHSVRKTSLTILQHPETRRFLLFGLTVTSIVGERDFLIVVLGSIFCGLVTYSRFN